MANTYTWNCRTVDVYPTYEGLDDVVYVVHWQLLATSSETHVVNDETVPYTTTTYNTQIVSVADISTDFITFADLTNEITTGWVETTMGGTEVQRLKDSLDANIDEQITPVSIIKTIIE